MIMVITIKIIGSLRVVADRPEFEFEVQKGDSLAEILRAVLKQDSGLRKYFSNLGSDSLESQVMFIVNRRIVSGEMTVNDSDTVGFSLPMGGG